MNDLEKDKELKRFKKTLVWLNMVFVYLANLLAKMNRRAIDNVNKIDK